MKRTILLICLSITIFIYTVQAQISEDLSDYLKNESAPGARASMGIFAAGYAKVLAEELFNFELNSWQNRLSSIGLAAIGYQILSYDSWKGVELKPFKFKKEWKGYWQGYLAGEGLDLFLGFVRKYEGAKFIVASTAIISIGFVIAEGESSKGWRLADDGPLTLKNLFTNRHSYWIHFAGSGGLYWAISNHTATEEQALLYTSSLIWLWEVKDGYLRWEDYGFIGGDGFSWRDGVAGTIAAFGSYTFDKWILPFIKRNIFAVNEPGKTAPQLTFYPDFYCNQIKFDLKIVF